MNSDLLSQNVTEMHKAIFGASACADGWAHHLPHGPLVKDIQKTSKTTDFAQKLHELRLAAAMGLSVGVLAALDLAAEASICRVGLGAALVALEGALAPKPPESWASVAAGRDRLLATAIASAVGLERSPKILEFLPMRPPIDARPGALGIPQCPLKDDDAANVGIQLHQRRTTKYQHFSRVRSALRGHVANLVAQRRLHRIHAVQMELILDFELKLGSPGLAVLWSHTELAGFTDAAGQQALELLAEL